MDITKYHIPKKLNFSIHKAEEGGFWLDSQDLSGLYTQGDTIDELVTNLEDALLTYFDVPQKEEILSSYRITKNSKIAFSLSAN